jgi:adenylate cyclase
MLPVCAASKTCPPSGDVLVDDQENQGVLLTRTQDAEKIPDHRLLDLIEWLSGNECRNLDEAGLIRILLARLCALPLPIDCLAFYLRTLHPEIRARIIVGSPEAPIEIHDREHAMPHIAAFTGGPVRQAMETREWRTVRADTDGAILNQVEIFCNCGIAELLIAPLPNGAGLVSAVIFGTRSAHGFTAAERKALERILPALSGACELRSLRRIGTALLDTYIGPMSRQRVLAGQVRRADVESLETGLLLSDLRDFTGLTNSLSPVQVLERLNLYFDQVVPAITAAGGEILKFIGDAVLAVFHCDEGAAASCAAAYVAANNIHARLAAAPTDTDTLSASIALHHGKVSYGNIGSGRRLDFTVIGRDVNLLSRIQGVGGATGHPLLMSARFTALLGRRDCHSIGQHALKGFPDPVELFVPRENDTSTHYSPVGNIGDSWCSEE